MEALTIAIHSYVVVIVTKFDVKIEQSALQASNHKSMLGIVCFLPLNIEVGWHVIKFTDHHNNNNIILFTSH